MLRRLLFGGVATTAAPLDLALLVLRLVFGISMALAHGLGKIPPSEGFVNGVANLGFPAPLAFAWAAALAEFAGGLLVAAGFATRPAALSVLLTMAVAAFGAHRGDPFGDKELAVLYGAGMLVLVLTGAGRVSIDALFRGGRR